MALNLQFGFEGQRLGVKVFGALGFDFRHFGVSVGKPNVVKNSFAVLVSSRVLI